MRRCIVSVAGVACRALLVGILIGGAAAGTGGSPAAAAASFTYTVNSTGDTNDANLTDHACDGTCTLRSAIEQANANCSADPAITTAILFTIPGSGVHTITPVPVTNAGVQNHPAALPNISCPVSIDGTTQGGAGYTGPPLIELDGSVAATTQLAPGLGFGGNVNGSTVRGLIVNRWNGAGLQFAGKGGATVVAVFVAQGNYIGTDASGSQASPNRSNGIVVDGPAVR